MAISSREKIIIGAMVLAVGYGGYSLVRSPPTGAPPAGPEAALAAANALVTAVVQDLGQSRLSEAERQIVARAATAWSRDPFRPAVGAAGSLPRPAEPGPGATFTYSGFLEIGAKRLAIINGMEYQVGEELAPSGYLVREIHPARVVLEGPDKKQTIVVPIEDDSP